MIKSSGEHSLRRVRVVRIALSLLAGCLLAACGQTASVQRNPVPTSTVSGIADHHFGVYLSLQQPRGFMQSGGAAAAAEFDAAASLQCSHRLPAGQ